MNKNVKIKDLTLLLLRPCCSSDPAAPRFCREKSSAGHCPGHDVVEQSFSVNSWVSRHRSNYVNGDTAIADTGEL
jgi:hypothetical protein